MAGEDCLDMSALESELTQTYTTDTKQEGEKMELDVLWQRIRTATTLMTNLKVKARVLTAPRLENIVSGIKQQDGNGIAEFSKDVYLPAFDKADHEAWVKLSSELHSVHDQDEDYMTELLSCVQTVTDVMETLVKRVILAESETALEKRKVTVGEEEIKKKTLQIKDMSLKLEEMERFAMGTNCVLNEMRQRVEELVEETYQQRQRAAENEEELCRVKRDFESLKSYVSSLISVRETLLSSEKQFQTIERLFERLVEKTGQLESEKMQKETEVRKLMEENVSLTALLDKKEAQLRALNEQCKVMALRATHL
ncbi:hypothetical protein DM860_017254 [Cuscuta australis]|uniref:Uncharacterized protein n=1 Tax=Cuscuta australis TaxID=267555 RepID=A0A328E4X2_9ASTE|nr:hypothetical protein DM860_017254 [Cuscuta australis]